MYMSILEVRELLNAHLTYLHQGLQQLWTHTYFDSRQEQAEIFQSKINDGMRSDFMESFAHHIFNWTSL